MPKVTTETIHLDGAVKKELVFKYDISVGVDGVFATTLPKDVVEKLMDAGITLLHNRQKTRGYFYDNTIDGMKYGIYEMFREFHKKYFKTIQQ